MKIILIIAPLHCYAQINGGLFLINGKEGWIVSYEEGNDFGWRSIAIYYSNK
jgi:hypothetical protein